MISTNGIRGLAGWCAAVVLAGAGPAWASLQNEYTLRASALMPGAKVLVDGTELKPTDESFVDPETIELRVEGAAGLTQAVIDIPDIGVTLVLNAVAVEVQVREDGGLSVAVSEWIEPNGWLDLFHQQDGPEVLLTASGATVRLPRGIVRVAARGGEGADVSVAAGQARVFVSESREQTLTATGDNAATISSAGMAETTRRAADAEATVFGAYQRLVQSSLLPDLVRVAEAVAEGDIEPPTRAAAVASVAVAPGVQVREIVPRGGTVSRVGTGLQNALRAAPTQNLAESFLAGGEAALAVVGARLQRTRVIGEFGGARSPLSINPELSRPFSIGRLGVGLR